MSFAEIQFPVSISYGSKGGPGFNTNIIIADSGTEERVSRWQSAKRQYNARYGVKSREDMQTVLQFFIMRGGSAQGFRYKDWLDFNSSAAGHNVPPDAATNVTFNDQILGSADSVTTQFQLIKRYTDASGTKVRNITKPVSGTVKIGVAGVLQTSGVTIDTTTGIVTFSAAPTGGGNVTAGFEFDVPVRFGKTADTVLMASIEDFGYGSTDPIDLIEIPDGLLVNEDVNCGGAVQVCMTENYLLSAGFARTYVFEPQSAGLAVNLPDTTSLPTGGPFFVLLNLGPSSIALKTFSGSAVATLASGQGVVVVLTLDGGGAKVWSVL